MVIVWINLRNLLGDVYDWTKRLAITPQLESWSSTCAILSLLSTPRSKVPKLCSICFMSLKSSVETNYLVSTRPYLVNSLIWSWICWVLGIGDLGSIVKYWSRFLLPACCEDYALFIYNKSTGEASFRFMFYIVEVRLKTCNIFI